jgi:hypothetical protein
METNGSGCLKRQPLLFKGLGDQMFTPLVYKHQVLLLLVAYLPDTDIEYCLYIGCAKVRMPIKCL